MDIDTHMPTLAGSAQHPPERTAAGQDARAHPPVSGDKQQIP